MTQLIYPIIAQASSEGLIRGLVVAAILIIIVVAIVAVIEYFGPPPAPFRMLIRALAALLCVLILLDLLFGWGYLRVRH